jgi:FAD/FMN-containing dehydrogenase
MTYESWGRFFRSRPARVVSLDWPHELPSFDGGSVLPYGLGRSYGDVCLNNGGTLLDTRGMSRFRRFDRESGLLECEAGATLDEILDVIVPAGWFLPVTPGTKFVTLGGCIANDVHGKNHHRAGTFGRWVRSLELQRSDRRSAPLEATIGGLGLTGLITFATIQLRKIESPFLLTEAIPFRGLDEFQSLSDVSDATHEYTVAWFDSFDGRDARGIFFRGNHTQSDARARKRRPMKLPVPPLLNPITIRAFNTFYFRAAQHPEPRVQHYDPFFYPLDAVANWNAAYGRRGFVQYQCVIPTAAGLEPVAEILDRTAQSKMASFLTVIKKFGELASPGMLSFPRPGTTVCLDFAVKHDALWPMLDDFDAIVAEAGGSVYPAKDSRLSPARFKQFFPQWEQFVPYIDPKFSSSFWRRVMA